MKKDQTTHITQIQITNIKITQCRYSHGYDNGSFTPVFNDAIKAIVCQKDISGRIKDVLWFLISEIDSDNHVTINQKAIAEQLGCDPSTVYKAIKTLVTMRILCRDVSTKQYTVSFYIVNPRLAYHGNTKKLNKNALPELLLSDGKTPLIPNAIEAPLLDDEDQNINL